LPFKQFARDPTKYAVCLPKIARNASEPMPCKAGKKRFGVTANGSMRRSRAMPKQTVMPPPHPGGLSAVRGSVRRRRICTPARLPIMDFNSCLLFTEMDDLFGIFAATTPNRSISINAQNQAETKPAPKAFSPRGSALFICKIGKATCSGLLDY